MKKSTVAAGCIAGVIAACSGAGLEAIGGAMDHAGHAMAGVGGSLEAAGHEMTGSFGGAVAGAGQLIAGTGATFALAGRSLTAGGSAGTSGAQAQQPNSDGLPRPHWVLRDKDGIPAQADVIPDYPVAPQEVSRFEHTTAATCAFIVHHGARRIGLSFDLATGQPSNYPYCSRGARRVADWQKIPGRLYLQATCDDGPMTTDINELISVASLGGDIFYARLASPSGQKVYQWDGAKCVATTVNSSSLYHMFPFIVFDDNDILPNPPYTLELVY